MDLGTTFATLFGGFSKSQQTCKLCYSSALLYIYIWACRKWNLGEVYYRLFLAMLLMFSLYINFYSKTSLRCRSRQNLLLVLCVDISLLSRYGCMYICIALCSLVSLHCDLEAIALGSFYKRTVRFTYFFSIFKLVSYGYLSPAESQHTSNYLL